ncbi:PhoD-like phosphatase [Lampropedia hyalina DSM 16112]|jgi:hypothetical protein|uniref:PhoD-like phosphatase n=1 Tax=Lampropedia hyalina DSM 16112 TaxID=1122156 RepID=A0A1M4WHA3_9BURK|nr:alkaline phosphatase D family protein [Lampropedia hyalina]SHE80618.1 PhoD-like phosphatase [Lampropedia hyalina DSM 16112]
MANHAFLVGPVLSFRGISGDGKDWQVTALVGIDAHASIPTMQVESRACPVPRELLLHRNQRFLRYDLSCPLQAQERRVRFGVPQGGIEWSFTVPALGATPRLAYVSCNGFSDPSGMRKLVRPENSVWEDLLISHDKELRGQQTPLLDREQLWHETRIHERGLQRFHLLLMGGDQIYFDSIWEDIPRLKAWVGLSRQEQLGFRVNKELEGQIEHYYFSLYSSRWLGRKRRAWGVGKPNRDGADALARIPTIMMWDDHDIFDGWGSYSCEMQQSPLFQTLFRHARRAFWVFQMQHALSDLPALEEATPAGFSVQDPLYRPLAWNTVLRHDPRALPLLDGQPGFTSAFRMGAVALVVADLRTERSRTQILGPESWSALKRWLNSPASATTATRHLLFMSSVPVVHPKLGLAEGWLDTFGQDHVLDSNADDLKDHWAHDDHEGERKRLLDVLFGTAQTRKLRVSILSGDVHVAAWGLASHQDAAAAATTGPIQQFTSSGVVHPSLMNVLERLFLRMLESTAAKAQQDAQYRIEMMRFPGHSRYVLAARNWLALELDEGGDTPSHKLWATWRCETETGFSNHMQTVP